MDSKTIVLDKDYSLTIRKVVVNNVKLSYKEKSKFEKLNSKSKIDRLNYLKSLKSSEISLSRAIKDSKYLRLYKDETGLHIRYEPDLEEEDFRKEMKIVKVLKDFHSYHLSEDINSGMTGDINRILISKGYKLE